MAGTTMSWAGLKTTIQKRYLEKPIRSLAKQLKWCEKTQRNITWAWHTTLYFGFSPFPVVVTTRIVSCLVGDSYKPSFARITGKGDNPNYTQIMWECDHVNWPLLGRSMFARHQSTQSVHSFSRRTEFSNAPILFLRFQNLAKMICSHGSMAWFLALL